MEREKDTETIDRRMARLRRQAGYSQKEVADALGVSPSTYRSWEGGSKISGEPYKKLAQLLGVTLTELMYGEQPDLSDLRMELELIKNSINRVISRVISLE